MGKVLTETQKQQLKDLEALEDQLCHDEITLDQFIEQAKLLREEYI